MTNEQIISQMSAQVEQMKQSIINWSKLIKHICEAKHLEVKDQDEELKVEISKGIRTDNGEVIPYEVAHKLL